MKRIVRISAGIVFLVLGFAGLFLPILQGILFIIIGLILLAPYSRCIRRGLIGLRKRYPKAYNASQSLRKKLATFANERIQWFR